MMSTVGDNRHGLGSSLRDHAVIIADTDGVIRLWGDGAVQLFGHSTDEAVGQLLDLVVPADLRPEHWRGFRAAVSGGSAKSEGHFFDAPALCRTGEISALRGQFHLVRDETGRVIAVMAIFARRARETGTE